MDHQARTRTASYFEFWMKLGETCFLRCDSQYVLMCERLLRNS